MERIKLTKNQKQVLRMVANGSGLRPYDYPREAFNSAMAALQHKGLVRAVFDEGHDVADAALTHKGMAYMEENPGLCNPINWWRITILALVAYLAAMIVWMIIN